ncbi:MAG: sulfotransferase domain-containing protein [Chloroflexota bacterium]|nr:sulfotransferase domain-containing protein [Chloroflexota bacterium]
MRIVVVSPPRSGNHWIECLLSTIYGLTRMGGEEKPDATTPGVFREWARGGGFPDNSLFHLHCRYRPKIADAIEATPALILTMVRNPYDAFVSRYFWTQQRMPPDREKAEARPRQRMVGKPLDDPDVLAFLADPHGFGSHLTTADAWLHSGRALVVRYEDLHRDPVTALTRATDAIEPVPPDRTDAAIEACTAENLRHQTGWKARSIRVAKVGDSTQRLAEAHLAIFRDQYADLIRSLGYEVR